MTSLTFRFHIAYYDISNIEGFSVGQKIEASGGQTVSCTSAGCDCTQAYGVGSESHPQLHLHDDSSLFFVDTAGTCAGSSVVDRAVRATGTANAAFTITYCP